MTGIEQLRKLGADAVRGGEVGRALCDIADQIERETEERSARLYDMRVGEETDVCELFGVEPVDDPLTSLRRHVENLNDTIENLRLELGEARDPAADVSMSAYDLLPQEERDAIAWVREHGGLERVKQQRYESIPRAAYERKRRALLGHIAECETALGKRREAIARLADENDALRLERAQMRPRLMPDGMEWLVEAWPRFEDGEPVRFGDEFDGRSGEVKRAFAFLLNETNLSIVCDGSAAESYRYGERVKRHAPKVLDADGAEIRVGDELYGPQSGNGPFVVEAISGDGELHLRAAPSDCRFLGAPDAFTHRAPVLAADGRPLREGERVWTVNGGYEAIVTKIDDGVVDFRGADGGYGTACSPSEQLTHERPDSWERIEEDAGCTATKYNERRGTIFTTKQQVARDLVRRAKALAERDR